MSDPMLQQKDVFLPLLNFYFSILYLTSGWNSNNFRGKNVKWTINKLFVGEIFSYQSDRIKNWKIMGRHFRAVHQLSLLFSFLKLEWKSQCLSWFEDTGGACCSIASNFGKLFVSLWQITNQSAIFHSCLVSILLCFGVITAYSISQHLVNDISALPNVVFPPALMSWVQPWLLGCPPCSLGAGDRLLKSGS